MAGSLLTAAHTSSASAICGIASARTNETASIRLTPVVASWSMSAILAVAGTGSSFCRPSRGPTSRTEIRDGRSVTSAPSPARPDRGALLVERRDPLPPVGQPDPLRLVGVDLAAREDQVGGAARPEPALRELGAAAARHQAHCGLG